ncbi:DUF1751 domain-containing protein [Candidatus Woesearchaeota archaeon]|nr:MAG: DUF1751 domain-containing protein [Candidatus Woesearchaeota archaeon]
MRNKKIKNFQIRNVAVTLLAINITFFLLQMTLGDWFTRLFLLDSANIFTRPWIIFTSMFLHSNTNHLFFNMFALFMFGPLIEQRIGGKRFLIVYFLSGIAAALAFALTPLGGSYALGASGAIMGMLGVTIMLMPDLRVLFFFVVPMSLRTAGIIFAALDILGLFGIGMPGVANISHLAGLACGLIYGYYLLKKKKEYSRSIVVRHHTRKNIKKDSSIDMSEEDINNYMKYGRL